MSRQLKRQLSKFEENEKKTWKEAYATYREETAEPARSPMESYKKRKLQRPPVIVPKRIPRFKYNKYINLDSNIMHFLDTALVVLINAENIQSWFFDKEIVWYFHTDLECGDRAISIARRMIEIAQNPETPREEEIDSYIERINCVSRTIEVPSKIPDVYKFALHILAQSGPIPDRLRLLSASPAELADFISAVIQKPITGEFDTKWEIEPEDDCDQECSYCDDGKEHSGKERSGKEHSDEEQPIGGGKEQSGKEQSDDKKPIGGGKERSDEEQPIGGGKERSDEEQSGKERSDVAIIDLVDEEDDDLPSNWRKRHYDEIIDLVSSSDEE
jgi:hypothetical protein